MISYKRVNQPYCRKKSNVGKIKAIRERIERMTDALIKANEYLVNGTHSHWHGFRAMFTDKACPPHKDWVQNVFIPRCERALRNALKLMEKLDEYSV